MKETVHIISHSHWDREWYMAYEKHRMKLIELIDNAMELFEKDDAFRSFHLDGQTIVLDDYLEIKPENREKVEQYIREGRFSAGPWYILQDEFLTSGEANVRNLLTGIQEAWQFGSLCRVGYFPDAFGNAGQMPQLLKQAGMKAVVFGRGVKPVGLNNRLEEGGEYESVYSEMHWESPDGSAMTGILFANWYNNGAEIPTDPVKAKAFWEEGLRKARAFAGTGQLLFMNGCDHQPVQKDLSEAIRVAQALYPDITFVHSDFDTYVDAVKAELDKTVSVVRGELTSQHTDGLWTLVNTASSRVDLKQRNRECETALEKEAEPLAVMAMLCGRAYPEELLRYSWKKLMQNHPHDSICCCSVDEVHREMAARFDKSLQVAKGVSEESLRSVAEQVDTVAVTGDGEGKQLCFSVFNTTGWDRTGVVSVVLDYERCYHRGLTEAYGEMDALALPGLVLWEATGRPVEAQIEDLGTAFGYDLPDDRFRQPYMARRLRVTFEAEKVPAFGYRTYVVREGKSGEQSRSMALAPRVMENDFLRVDIQEDGSYTLTEKSRGKCYRSVGYYEDTGDMGNEYIYVQDGKRETFTTRGQKAEIVLEEDSPFRTIWRVTHCLEVPESADELLEQERRQCAHLYKRKAGRSGKKTAISISTLLTLERNARGMKVETRIQNTAKDHRIRVVIPTGLETDSHFADSLFDVVERPNRRGKAWKNPSGCDRQQNFVAMADAQDGILVANIGLYEYEVLAGQENAIAVTLLRAVGEMGDWGAFPTPEAQMQGAYTLKYEILPFTKERRGEAFQEAYQFQAQLLACQIAPGQKGRLPAACSFFGWRGEGLNLTGMKRKEGAGDIIVRYVNYTDRDTVLEIERKEWMEKVYKSNIVEENLGAVAEDGDGSCRITVHPHEIISVGIENIGV